MNCDERSTVAASTTLEPVRALRVSARGAIAPQARTSAKRRNKIIDLGTRSGLAAAGEALPIDDHGLDFRRTAPRTKCMRSCPQYLINDKDGTEAAIQTLTGRDVAPRFQFIMERAPRIDEIDV